MSTEAMMQLARANENKTKAMVRQAQAEAIKALSLRGMNPKHAKELIDGLHCMARIEGLGEALLACLDEARKPENLLNVDGIEKVARRILARIDKVNGML
jgi:hypothetical protein